MLSPHIFRDKGGFIYRIGGINKLIKQTVSVQVAEYLFSTLWLVLVCNECEIFYRTSSETRAS